ncbi:MAG: glycosyltransferase family 39 protein [Zoogloeaceae bacterium]|jgi:4-amino-4-deoxy-L-arabinose transferase-like glycosyltransferase|nr:glycosyltransferase family 39 protein [Zoogloeaceae bacterium]
MRLFSSRSFLKLPLSGWTLAGLLGFYVFAGLFGHDPWMSEDVTHLAVARDFLLPSHAEGWGLALAGRPFFSAPLYYWSAAFTEWLFGWMLPTHDALRLASGLWTALALCALYYAGREMYGREAAAAPPLLLSGSFGFIVHAHEAQPMLVLLAAISFALLAFTLWPRKPKTGSAFFALAFLLAVLGSGWAGVLFLCALLPLPFLFFPVWRGKIRFVWIALLACLAILAVAAFLLNSFANQWFSGWFVQEAARFSGVWEYGRDALVLMGMFSWFSWPLWPLALWALWRSRRHWRTPGILLPSAAFLALLLLLPIGFEVRRSAAILLLPPLALLATPGALTLRRGAANALDWFSGMVFSAFAALLWTGWCAMVFGVPARLARRALELEPGFSGRFDGWLFAVAVCVSVWWLWLILSLPRSPYRCVVRWSAGLAVSWLLAVSLWLPWVDHGKNYRAVASAVAARVSGSTPGCVASWQIGEAQRAAFFYFASLRVTPISATKGTKCQWLLAEERPRAQRPFSWNVKAEDWEKVWESRKPGGRRDFLRLYRRRYEKSDSGAA